MPSPCRDTPLVLPASLPTRERNIKNRESVASPTITTYIQDISIILVYRLNYVYLDSSQSDCYAVCDKLCFSELIKFSGCHKHLEAFG